MVVGMETGPIITVGAGTVIIRDIIIQIMDTTIAGGDIIMDTILAIGTVITMATMHLIITTTAMIKIANIMDTEEEIV
jgi:hypothetical protein